MTKLKTLKDIYVRKESPELVSDLIFDDIKQEAIKHIKSLDNEWDKLVKEGNDPNKNFRYFVFDKIEYQKTFIKHFFNITEEDLMTNEELNKREHGERGNN